MTQVERAHQFDVLEVAMIIVAGDFARLVLVHCANHIEIAVRFCR